MTEYGFSVISASDAQAALRTDLHLEGADSNDHLALISQALRRLCGILCPCSSQRITDRAFASLRVVHQDQGTLHDEIKFVLESLLVAGDIVELGTGSVADDACQQLVHCAPPSYLRLNTRVYLFGIAADDAPFLPSGVASRVVAEGSARYIDTDQPDHVCEQLFALGLRKMTSEEWFRKANYGKASHFLARMRTRLEEHGVDGSLEGVRVLEPSAGGWKGYPSRWVEPALRTGLHLIRAKRSFGADAWLLASLRDGVVERSIPLGGIDNTMTRSCDVAWLTQLAMDATAGHPNGYRIVKERDGWRLTLNFPLPLNAIRRLLHWGGHIHSAVDHYQTFWVPDDVRDVVERFLQEQCWMQLRSD
ncbi:hypothetical protein HDE76_003785 [Rhodanobacter sp. ANJX3]|uniref:hypothetical protein n=1 Tax=Rhodanobacter sp. ANJX3 TaxID=2723083 RepID=UPI001616AF7D|nr:hypothetical protein [Rhodanobacter sp. ANJX3]MBB5360541.1 hypothetical protein [Rhodanobacter sp. ANJX3]